MTAAEAARRHRRFAGAFTDLVRGTTDWDAPAPVPGWTSRDVVCHLVEWFPAFLAGGDVRLGPGPSPAADPVAAWIHHAAAVQALLDDPATEQRRFSHPVAGTHWLAVAIDRFYTPDVFMHCWDLARATGQHYAMDAGYAAELLDGMQSMEQVIRSSGQYGHAVPVPADASVPDRLLGFIGRDPYWTAG